MGKVKKISKYIDQLNREKMPEEHSDKARTKEMMELLDTVRRVKSLKDPVLPEENFPDRVSERISKALEGYNEQIVKRPQSDIKRRWVRIMAAAAAVVLLAAFYVFIPAFHSTDIVQAMEQALDEVKAYRGTLEVVEMNELGETITQARREIWADREGSYYLREMEGFMEGMITVNNGKMKWQIRPEEETVFTFTAFPDAARFTFELGKEIEEVQNALSIKEIGEEMISGRIAVILEVTPDGGASYHLWVDRETKLPLQRQSAMQNALQYRITYTEIEFIDSIPGELLEYQLPVGYEEINTNHEQFVNSLDEAEDILSFAAVIPEVIPKGYFLNAISADTDSKTLRIYFKSEDGSRTVVISQAKADGKLTPASNAILGTVNDSTAEILAQNELTSGYLGGAYQGLTGIGSIRWQEAGYEFTVLGNINAEEIAEFAESLTEGEVLIPSAGSEKVREPQVEVSVDLEVEEATQKSVDGGHSPWRLDPAYVAQVFASLLISPEGITGDYPINYEDIQIIENNSIEAIAEINDKGSIAKYVYLKRLIRQDATGIWTVVGYDPAE